MRKQIQTKIQNTFEVSAIESVYYQEFRQYYGRPEHKKEVWQIIYIVSGERDMILNGENITLHQNQFVCISPQVSRQNLHTRAYCDVCCINFNMTSPNPMEPIANRILDLLPSERELLMKITHAWLESMEDYSDDVYNGMRPKEECSPWVLHSLKLYMEMFLLNVSQRILNPSEALNFFAGGFEQHDSKIVSDIKLYFSENLERVLTIQEIAEHFNMAQPTIKVLFKKATGDSLIHFFNSMKVERARSLMHTTDMTISEISEKLGFCSPTHFSTTFKKYEKMSPKQYMEYCEKLLPHLNRKIRHGT